ncbi:SgcJ/EcaC family oxidoreductase [uncultured Williamsia sp.]|uniref:YybH family protein n=1 Tax=uncultured Williamsia sp. TaxID=259311 RepID=UPI0026270A90|nr:SgcJ/EcaC family oxidoreductase [uncultured Williamsia sp.]
MTVTDHTAAVLDVHELHHRWEAAFNAGDIDAMMAMYTDDAVIVPGPGAPEVRGTDAIRQALVDFVALGGTIHGTDRFWLVAGDLALGSGAHQMTGAHAPDGTPIDLHGITCEIAVRGDDGAWRFLIDHPFGGSDQG